MKTGISLIEYKNDTPMNPNELMLGNLVYYQEELCEVIRIEPDKIYTQVLNKSILPFVNKDHIKPIPMDAGWATNLLFFPYDKSKAQIEYFNNGFEFKLQFLGKRWHLFHCYDGAAEESFIAAFDYVHQLQNLYFALTGKDIFAD